MAGLSCLLYRSGSALFFFSAAFPLMRRKCQYDLSELGWKYQKGRDDIKVNLNFRDTSYFQFINKLLFFFQNFSCISDSFITGKLEREYG